MTRTLGIATLLLLVACGKSSPLEPDNVIGPQCASPAPLINENNRAHPDRIIDEYIVLFRQGTNTSAESSRLASKYGFTVKEIFTIIPAIAADLHPDVVAKLRCEPSVQTIEFSKTNIPPP